jgi:uncharacterized repeat protein (TIGR01451 family)
VIKHVVNDNGGSKVASDFTLTIGGVTASGGQSFAGAESPGVTKLLSTVGSYTVTEGAHAGYDVSSSADCSGTIALGEHKTCTITNDDQAAHLVVIKHVVNDNGGTAAAGDFTLDSGGANDSPDDFAGAESPGTSVTLDAGSYAVTETGPSGYTRSDSADCSGTIALGETKTCTVTNDDQAATLTVIKHVVNDNGGTAVAADFTLDSGGANDSPDDFAGAESPGTSVTLDAGSYAVTETGPSGYTESDSADCAGTIAPGETKTCTVTNDDNAPALHLRKTVTNDNGGAAAATDWTLTATGTGEGATNLSGKTPVDSGSGFKADTYTLGETGPAGYTGSAWTCTSGEKSVPVVDSQVTIDLGADVTCTINNNDNPPPPPPPPPPPSSPSTTLTVTKSLAPATDPGRFNLLIDGLQWKANAGNNDSTGPVSVSAGTHKVGESQGTGGVALSEYVSTTTCATGGVSVPVGVDGSVNVASGTSVTCVVSNARKSIDLSITKVASPRNVSVGQNVTYTEVVTNSGPGTATGVVVSDPLPAKDQFVSVTSTQGTCTGTNPVTCTIGTLAPGASATITLVIKNTSSGGITNTATVVGDQPEANTANNTASATYKAAGPFRPPAPSCYSVTVTPKSLSVGHHSKLSLVVRANGRNGKPAKGVKVSIKGAGIAVITGATNKSGLVRTLVTPSKPGIVLIKPTAKKGCTNQRIGAVGAFTPPVTG